MVSAPVARRGRAGSRGASAAARERDRFRHRFRLMAGRVRRRFHRRMRDVRRGVHRRRDPGELARPLLRHAVDQPRAARELPLSVEGGHGGEEERDHGHRGPHQEPGNRRPPRDVGRPRPSRLVLKRDHHEQREDAEVNQRPHEVHVDHPAERVAEVPVRHFADVPGRAREANREPRDPPVRHLHRGRLFGEQHRDDVAHGHDVPLRHPQRVNLGHRRREQHLPAPAQRRLRVGGGTPGIGNVARAPGMPHALGVVRPQCLPVPIGEDAVVAQRQEQPFDVHAVPERVAALHEDVPVLRDDLFVPVVDLVQHLPAERIARRRELHTPGQHHVRKPVDAREAVRDAQRRGDVPDVVRIEDGRLPERAVRVLAGQEEVVERLEVPGVEHRVRVAARDRVAEDVLPAVFDKAEVRLACGPRLVRTLARGLVGKARRVEGGEHVAEGVAVLANEVGGFRLRFRLACLHRHHDGQLAGVRLRRERVEGAGKPLFALLVVGDDYHVARPFPGHRLGVRREPLAVLRLPVRRLPVPQLTKADDARDGHRVGAAQPVHEERRDPDCQHLGQRERPPEDGRCQE